MNALPIGLGAVFIAVALMAWDHLWGNQGGADDSFPVDSPTFFLTLGLIVVAAVVVFGVTVPRSIRNPDDIVHRSALIHSGVAVVLALPATWLGFPVVVAGGGVALGLRALDGPHRRMAVIAVALGVAVIVFGVMATAFPPADTD